MAEMKLVFHPAGSGANRRYRQAMLCQQSREFGHRKGLGRLGENFDGIEAEFGRRAAGGREAFDCDAGVKYEGPLSRLGHQADCDGGFHGVMPE